MNTALAPSWRHDLLAGFIVFLIALPLCLGIALASGFPAIAGIYAAIIGGVLGSLISDSELTIKGPAAALIVIASGAVIELGSGGGAHALADLTPEQRVAGYRMALAAGVAAGLMQVVFGLRRLGRLGEFFPSSAVHGLFATVGLILVTKQSYILLGVPGKTGGTFRQLSDLPATLLNPLAHGVNPRIALIGGVSLLILVVLPLLKSRAARIVPVPFVVLAVAIPLGSWFDLLHEHDYTFNGRKYHLGAAYLVTLPDHILRGFAAPDFSALATYAGWKYAVMFALVGSLATLLTAKAVELLDPWRRKTDLNRDLLAVGIGGTCAALVGGLPMISEIVRSKASIDCGARTRLANAFPGLSLLVCVTLIPGLLHCIPQAALAAILVVTGFRLASPRTLLETYRIGAEQLLIFVSTMLAAVATDLVIGIGVGIAVKLLIHLVNGVPPRALFGADVEVRAQSRHGVVVVVRRAALFSNWLGLKRRLDALAAGVNVTVDLSETRLVDHTVMAKLDQMAQEFARRGDLFIVTGLDKHRSFSRHPHAARKQCSIAPAASA